MKRQAALILMLVAGCSPRAGEETRDPVGRASAGDSTGKSVGADGSKITCHQLLDKVAGLGGLPYSVEGQRPREDGRELTAQELSTAFLASCDGYLMPPEARLCIMRARMGDDLKPCKQLTRTPAE